MSAEVLREAAALIRARAVAAREAPWSVGGWDHQVINTTTGEQIADPFRREDANHIASWHPGVALEVATWLDAAALVMEVNPQRHRGMALAVARAYLGVPA